MIAATRLEKFKIKDSFAAAALSYDTLATLQRQVGENLLNKFSLQTQAGLILDLGCGTGFLTRHILENSPTRQMVALDIALPMLFASREKNQEYFVPYICADAEKIPLAEGSVQQIVSNLALQWCQDLPAVFADCKRILQTGGQFVFSTFGPTTLKELKTAWAAVDEFTHVNTFYATAEIICFLQQAGFASINVENVVYQRTYPSIMLLMRELKGLGAHNVNVGRNKKITTPQQLQRMIASYESQMTGSELLASYEIIYVRAEA